MNYTIITRCFRPNNIQIIKDNLKEIFSKQNKHTYIHHIIVDLSHEFKQNDFKEFKDDITQVHFTYQKIDHYNYNGVDELVCKISDDNDFIYVLDDDNLIKQNFPQILDNYVDEDILFFKNDGHSCFEGKELKVGSVMSHIDLCNFMAKAYLIKKIRFLYSKPTSFCSDCIFVDRVLKENVKTKYLSDSYVIYGALPQIKFKN